MNTVLGAQRTPKLSAGARLRGVVATQNSSRKQLSVLLVEEKNSFS